MIDGKSVHGMQKRKSYIRKRAGKDNLYLFSTEMDVELIPGVKSQIENWFITTEPSVGWIMRIESKKGSNFLYFLFENV